MPKKNFLHKIVLALFVSILLAGSSNGQVINDPLNGSTVGTKVGGTFTSEGYKPGVGTNHILYSVPAQIANGYVEFEMKGFTQSGISGSENDHGFIMMYDGRGIGNTPSWPELRDNYFRWNFHWRQKTSTFKAVVNTAAPVSKRLNSTYAVFIEGVDKDGSGDFLHRDWYDEPNGSSFSWDNSKSKWYKVKIQWSNKTYKVYVDGVVVWSNHKTGLHDYTPKDFKIWLGSGVDKYDSDNGDVVYRNFMVVNQGGSSTYLSASPITSNVSSSAGNTNLNVSSNVSWSVSDDASWLSVSPTSGSNNGSLNATFTENTSSSSRTGTITLTGGGITQKVYVVQAGASTSSNFLNASPSNQNVAFGSGNTTFSISSDVSWIVSDDASWLSVSPTSGSNNGSLNATFTENTSSSSRTATITISGGGITKNVSVTQAGKSSTVSDYLNVPSTLNVSNSIGETTIDVSSNSSWSVSDNTTNPDWLNKTPKTGNGDGKVQVSWLANTSGVSRTGQLVWTSGSITKITNIVQGTSTSTNFLNISPGSQNVASASGSTSFNISSNLSWVVSDDASWLTVSPGSGSNNGSFNASFTENTSSNSRTATITISGGGIIKNVSVMQAGKSSSGGNSLDVPETITVDNSGGETVVDVSSNLSWVVSDNTTNPDWLNKSPKTGTGNGKVSVSWLPNTSGVQRTGQLIWKAGNITKITNVVQGGGTSSGGGSFLNVPETLNISSSGGETVVDVSSNLSWVVSDNTSKPDWINKSPKTGTGNGKVDVSWLPNPSSSPRTGQLIWKSGSITKVTTITQAGSTTNFAKEAGAESEKNSEVIPTNFALANYPNPFNPTTTIQFDLPESGHAELVVYNSLGQQVANLVSEYKNAGTYQIMFDASELTSGIYFSRLTFGNQIKTSKLLLLE